MAKCTGSCDTCELRQDLSVEQTFYCQLRMIVSRTNGLPNKLAELREAIMDMKTDIAELKDIGSTPKKSPFEIPNVADDAEIL